MDSSEGDWFSNLARQPPAAPCSSRSVTRRADMPSEPSAYSVDNFEPRPPQELVCTVCRGVYRDPVECPCRHVFCSYCIHGWLALGTIPGSGSCPLCRREVSMSQVVPVVPLVANMIARLTVRCPNRETGCTAKVALESLNHHLETCDFGRALCSDCGAPMLASELAAHRRECVSLQQQMVRCKRDCCFSLFAERQRDENCVHEMRSYINSLEQTRDMLHHQIDHTLQCLSQLQCQIRELAARVETCAGRLRDLSPAPSLPKSTGRGSHRWEYTEECRLPLRQLNLTTSSGSRASGSLTFGRRARFSVPGPSCSWWKLTADTPLALSEPQQDEPVQQCASAFKLFPNDGPTVRLFHDTDGACSQPNIKNRTPPEASGIDVAAFGPPTVPFSTASSAIRTAGRPQLTFQFGVEQPSKSPLPLSQSRSTHGDAPTLTSTSTRLSVPTVSEMLAAGGQLPVTPSDASNAVTSAGGARTSTAMIDLAAGLSREHRLYSRVPGGRYPPSTAGFAMHADEVASGIRTLPPASQTQRTNAADTGMEYGQLRGGDCHLSSFIRQLWESGKRYDGSNSPE